MKGKILIVDDEADLRSMLKAILQDDYTVTEAESGAALQKCFSLDAPDVILLDLKLPDANGLDLLAADQENLAGHGSHRADGRSHF